jgi:hypothetical protein
MLIKRRMSPGFAGIDNELYNPDKDLDAFWRCEDVRGEYREGACRTFIVQEQLSAMQKENGFVGDMIFRTQVLRVSHADRIRRERCGCSALHSVPAINDLPPSGS